VLEPGDQSMLESKHRAAVMCTAIGPRRDLVECNDVEHPLRATRRKVEQPCVEDPSVGNDGMGAVTRHDQLARPEL
jgi:hypothetical protein